MRDLPGKRNMRGVGQSALVKFFTRETWLALGVACVCLLLDGYAVFRLPHHSAVHGGIHGATLFAVVLWMVEIVLAGVAGWLIRFAFSVPPAM